MDGACLMIMIGLLLRWLVPIEDVAGVVVHHLDEAEAEEIHHNQMTLVITVDKKVTGLWTVVKMIMVSVCAISRMENASNVVKEGTKDLTVLKMVVLVDDMVEEEVALAVEADLHALAQYRIHLDQDHLQEGRGGIDLTVDQVRVVIIDPDQEHLQDTDDVAVVEVNITMTVEGIIVDPGLLALLKKVDPVHHAPDPTAQITNARNCRDNNHAHHEGLHEDVNQDLELHPCDHLLVNQKASSSEKVAAEAITTITVEPGADHLARHPSAIIIGPRKLIVDLSLYPKISSKRLFALHRIQEINNKSNKNKWHREYA